MATITSAIEIQDRFTSVLNRFESGLTNVTRRFQNLQNVMNRDVNFNATNTSIDTMNSNLSEVNPIVVSINTNINNINNTLNNTNNTLNNTNTSFHNINHTVNNAADSQENLNQSIRTGQSEANGLLSGIKRIVATYLTLQAAKGITNLSDEFTQTKARLDMMNDGLQSTIELQNMIFQSAQRSRATYQNTANAVSKMGILAKDSFNNNEEVVAFMEQINKQFTIAGTNAQGVEAATLQLTQAMGAGALRGEELNSIFEQAPTIIQSIAEYMDVPVGKIKDMASEGEITADIVKKAMFSTADETNAKFESMPKTISQIWASIKNNALMEFQPILLKINEIANNQGFNTLANNISSGCAFIAVNLLNIINLVCSVAQFFSNNWGIIGPIVYGIVAAFVLYNSVLAANAIWNGIVAAAGFLHEIQEYRTAAALLANVNATLLATNAQYALAVAQAQATVAQAGFNTVLLASPITWIIYAIIALIAIFYAVVGVINKVKGTSISATGIISGAFAMLGAAIWNVVAYVWNAFASFAEFLANVFNHPVYSVKALFANLAINVLDMCISMTSGIDNFATNFANGVIDGVNIAIRALNWFIEMVNKIPGIELPTVSEFGHTASVTGNLQGAKADIQNWLGDAPSDYISVPKMEMKSLGGAAVAGYNWGDNLSNKFNIPDNTQDAGSPFDYQSLLDAAEGANQGAGDTAKNTGAMKDALEITDEDLKYLRDFAEMEAINKYTTAEIKVEMTNNNTVNSDMDIDGIVDTLAFKVEEQMNMTAEGVYD